MSIIVYVIAVTCGMWNKIADPSVGSERAVKWIDGALSDRVTKAF